MPVPGSEIVDLVAATTLSGAELVHISQGGNSRKATLANIIADLEISNSVIRSGSGAPSAGLGVDGDYYIRTSNDDLYKKAQTTPIRVCGPNGTIMKLPTPSTVPAGTK